MRHLSLIVLAASMLSIGCSHKDKKADDSKVPASPVAAAKPAGDKVHTDSKSNTGASRVECLVKGDDRVLEIRDKGKGCELAYTKAGKEGVVASAANGKDYCVKALDKLQEKLKGAGYTCK